jgi:flagellar biosynthetic protein FliP
MLRWLIDRDPPAFKLSRLTRFRIILSSIIRRLPSKWLVIGLLALGFASPALSQAGLPIVNMVDDGSGGTKYSLTLQLLALMTVLTLLPSLLLMMTSFVRIIIVMSLLRQALGTAQTPPNQVLVGLALFLTLFIMTPVLNTVYDQAISPYMDETISFEAALVEAEIPIRNFMLNQTRESDIAMFVEIAGNENIETPADVPFTTLVPAFITSELKSAFSIGFLIYIPFVVIDLVVASVLMSMGMMMLSPMMISMPFKLMLFVLVDGWTLIMGSLTSSFAIS